MAVGRAKKNTVSGEKGEGSRKGEGTSRVEVGIKKDAETQKSSAGGTEPGYTEISRGSTRETQE